MNFEETTTVSSGGDNMASAASGQSLRFGIIGCGSIGPTHAGAIQQIEEARLVAVADTIAERADNMAETFNVTRAYDSHEALINDDGIDVVCICTPSGLHADVTIEALRAGKHVIVEKPMEVSLEACDRMIAAADETGKKLSVISQHRFDAATMQVKQAIDTGNLGRIILADATVKWWRTQEYYDSGDWRGTWKFDGGGALMNQGVHTVDLLQWLAGGVSSLYAQTRTAAHERMEVEDIAVAALTFASGAVGTLTATTAAYPGFAVRLDIYGTEGSAVIEGDRLKTMVLKSGQSYNGEGTAAHALSVAQGGTASVKDEAAKRDEEMEVGEVWGDAHRAQIEDVIRAIRTDTQPLIDGRAARKPLEIILGVYESARTGQPVTLGC
jgi:UDP-N-acetyl-2-amino-2-deoxyglucuronate dehydrogenase